MKKVVFWCSLATVVMATMFSSCKKDGYQKPFNKAEKVNPGPFAVTYAYFSDGSALKSSLLKAGFGDTIKGIISEGDTIKLGSIANLILNTTPVTDCYWLLDGDTIAKNVDQALFSLKTSKMYSAKVVNCADTSRHVSFKISAGAVVIPPPVVGISKLLRLISVEKVGPNSLLTWRGSREGTLSSSYTFVSNWTSWATGTAFYGSSLVGTDSIQFSFMVSNSGLASVRKSFMLVQSNGTWLVADSLACSYYDPNFDSNHDGVADNIFSFYYDGVNAVVYDANEKIVVPPTPAPAAPGKLGDVVNAINTAEISPTGNFIIYFKMTTGSTVAFQSGKNNAAAPAFSWTDSTNVAYLVTTAVAGSNFWSQVTVLNTDLKTYNWWVPGTGTGKNFKADNAMLTASPFYITAANADNVALAK